MSNDQGNDMAMDQLKVLDAFSKALQRETHVLKDHPDLLWQHLYNRLQWKGKTLLAQHLVNSTCGNRGAAINCNGKGNRYGCRRNIHV